VWSFAPADLIFIKFGLSKRTPARNRVGGSVLTQEYYATLNCQQLDSVFAQFDSWLEAKDIRAAQVDSGAPGAMLRNR